MHTHTHTYEAHFPLLSWCLYTRLRAHIPNICIEIGNGVKSLIPRVSTVPHDPTPQCPPTHIYKNRTIFSWIPMCAWHLLLHPLILCTKGCTYTCMPEHAHTHTHTQSRVSERGRVRIYVVIRGGTQWLLHCCELLCFHSDESIMWAVAVVWGHPLSAAFYQAGPCCLGRHN